MPRIATRDELQVTLNKQNTKKLKRIVKRTKRTLTQEANVAVHVYRDNGK